MKYMTVCICKVVIRNETDDRFIITDDILSVGARQTRLFGPIEVQEPTLVPSFTVPYAYCGHQSDASPEDVHDIEGRDVGRWERREGDGREGDWEMGVSTKRSCLEYMRRDSGGEPRRREPMRWMGTTLTGGSRLHALNPPSHPELKGQEMRPKEVSPISPNMYKADGDICFIV